LGPENEERRPMATNQLFHVAKTQPTSNPTTQRKGAENTPTQETTTFTTSSGCGDTNGSRSGGDDGSTRQYTTRYTRTIVRMYDKRTIVEISYHTRFHTTGIVGRSRSIGGIIHGEQPWILDGIVIMSTLRSSIETGCTIVDVHTATIGEVTIRTRHARIQVRKQIRFQLGGRSEIARNTIVDGIDGNLTCNTTTGEVTGITGQ
jgi:hypothetical protein